MQGKIIIPNFFTVLCGYCLFSTHLFAQRIAPAAYSSTVKVNYVRTWDAVIPMTDESKLTANIHIDSFRVGTQYFDGLVRPIQKVIKQGSLITGTSATDFVSAIEYDSLGREQFKYLPFAANSAGSNTHINDGLFKLNPFQQDSSFNKNMFSDETFYYGKIVFENSPLNRLLENFAPGDNWVGSASQSTESNRRGIKMKYWINTTADSGHAWK